VLFPDGPLPLRVFEPRYLDMISSCLKEDSSFGVLLIASGGETSDVQTHNVGTLATITDWYQGSDGILGITAFGGKRFRLGHLSRERDGLYTGDVGLIEPEPAVALPAEYRAMAGLLQVIIDDLGRLYESQQKQYDDATWVGCRFAEILPLSLEQKQHCLELNDPVERLEFLQPLLREIRQERSQ